MLQARHHHFRLTAQAQHKRSQASLKVMQTQLQSWENQQDAATEAQSRTVHDAEQMQVMTHVGHHGPSHAVDAPSCAVLAASGC